MNGFATFAEAFCAGWNAYKDCGRSLEAGDDSEAIGHVILAAFERSGSRLAHRVLAGELTEVEARSILEERRG